MPESLTLTTPVPSLTQWYIQALDLRRGMTGANGVLVFSPGDSVVTATLIGLNGEKMTYTWRGATADANIIALNKMNLSTITLNKRIMNLLISDGVLPGTATGVAD